jgi:fatty acid desaturase
MPPADFVLQNSSWAAGDRDQLAATIRRQLWIDGVGIVALHGVLLGWALTAGAIGRYLVFWVVVERIVGIIIQAREHLEHYGLWRSSHSHLLTQLYATRNVQAIGLVNWLMGGLPYHSIHHAFPGIPFDRLPEAFDRVQAVLAAHGQPPLVVAPGYWPGSWQLSRDRRALIATAIDPQPQRSPT